MIHAVQRVTVTIAAGALLAVGLAAAPASAAEAATPTDLLISEYVEGSSTNKAIELYNPTDESIDLAGYQLGVYFNGGTSSTNFNPTGSVGAGDTFVFADNLLAAFADQTTGAGLWNGDDTIVLRRGVTVVDSLGQIGFDPGAQWGADAHIDRRQHAAAARLGLRRRHEPDRCVRPCCRVGRIRQWTRSTDSGRTPRRAATSSRRQPVINEFSASTVGTDVEYVELLVEPGTDLSTYRVLEIEGDFAAGSHRPRPAWSTR